MSITFDKPAGNTTVFHTQEGFMGADDIIRLRNLDPIDVFIDIPKYKPLSAVDVNFKQILNSPAGGGNPYFDEVAGDIQIDSLSVGGNQLVGGLAFINTQKGSANLNPENAEWHGDSLMHSGPATSSVNLGGGASPIDEDGLLNLTITVIENAKVFIEGLHELSPKDYFTPGEVTDTLGNKGYSYEYSICTARAQRNEPIIVDRYEKAVEGCKSQYGPDGLDDSAAEDKCINDAYTLYDPDNAYDNCLNSCRTGGTLKDGSHCYDERYHADGGRLPNIWHIGQGGCGCGSEQQIGCDFSYLATED